MEGGSDVGEWREDPLAAAARPGRILILAGALFALAAAPADLAGAVPPTSRKVRTIPVAVVADPRLGTNEAWKVVITRIMMEVNPFLREAIGVRLRIKAYLYLDPVGDPAGGAGPVRPLAPSLRSWLPAFLEHASHRTDPIGEIVIGLVPVGEDGPVDPGIADYLNGVIVMKFLEAEGGMPYVLLHEICHVFGAVDLMEAGSVMSLRRPSFRIDAFTKSIMRVNRDRSFRRGECPLFAEKLAEAVALYGQRDSLGLGEGQLGICLDKLRSLGASLPRAQDRRRRPAGDDPNGH